MSYIPIGHVGEFNSRHWPFPMADLLAEFPGCVAQVMHRPSGSKDYYPVVDTRMEGTDLIWTFTEEDTTKKGWGECKLVLTDPDGSMLWMSDSIQTLCGDGYTVGENPPEPVVQWIQPLLTAAAGVRTAVAEVKQYADEAEAHALNAAEQANAAAQDAGKAAGSADAAHADAVAAYQSQGLAGEYAAQAKESADRAVVDFTEVNRELADHEDRITELEEHGGGGAVTKEAIDNALGMDVVQAIGTAEAQISGLNTSKADRSEIPAPYDDTAIRGQVSALQTTVAGKADKSEIPAPYDDTEVKQDIDQLQTEMAGKAEKSEIPAPYDDAEIRGEVGALKENISYKLDRVIVVPTDDSVIATEQIVDVIGIPAYIAEDGIAQRSAYHLTQSGWYVFAEIMAPKGSHVGAGFTVYGAAGYVLPAAGSDHVDVAVRFGAAAESQIVTVNWGAKTCSYVFRATDLAIRNLDARATYYVYDMSEFATWEYVLTTDTAFVAKRDYYIKSGDSYTKAEVTVGSVVTANTYYVHSKVTLSGYVRNVSYNLQTVDCPVVIVMPDVGDGRYGAWVEVQGRFTAAFSVTLKVPQGVKMSSTGSVAPTAGVNVLSVQYFAPGKVWRITNTHWNDPS